MCVFCKQFNRKFEILMMFWFYCLESELNTDFFVEIQKTQTMWEGGKLIRLNLFWLYDILVEDGNWNRTLSWSQLIVSPALLSRFESIQYDEDDKKTAKKMKCISREQKSCFLKFIITLLVQNVAQVECNLPVCCVRYTYFFSANISFHMTCEHIADISDKHTKKKSHNFIQLDDLIQLIDESEMLTKWIIYSRIIHESRSTLNLIHSTDLLCELLHCRFPFHFSVYSYTNLHRCAHFIDGNFDIVRADFVNSLCHIFRDEINNHNRFSFLNNYSLYAARRRICVICLGRRASRMQFHFQLLHLHVK